jgi:hypothetical protein
MTTQQIPTRHRNPGSLRSTTGHRIPGNQKMLYQRWINELWAGCRNAHDLVSADFDELQQFVDNTRGSLRELMFVVDVGPFIDGDLVAARWIATGSTKNGPARFTGNDILRCENGRIAEYWSGTSAA